MYDNSEELSPAEEKLLYKISMAKGATARGAGIHSAAGATAGTGIGFALGLPAGGIGAAPAAGIGGLIGGTLGALTGTIQGGMEEAKVADYEKRLAAIQKQNQKANLEAQAKSEAFSRLLGKYSSY
jgi:phage tail tape-measure protein